MNTTALDVQPNSHQLNTGVLGTLPPAPARVLVLGNKKDFKLQGLKEMGYQITRYPTYHANDFVQWPTGTREAIFQVSLALPESATESFDAAVVLDLSPFVHPLSLWNQLEKWLARRATVTLIVDCEATSRPRLEHWLEYVSAIGARCGFSEQERVDDRQSISPGNTRRTYLKMGSGRWKIHHASPTDYEAIATLFMSVFGHPLSRALWQWKYGDGHGNAVVAERNGRLIAHYGGMYRDVIVCGEANWAFQICDVMVHPDERGVLTRNGAFLLTAATSAEIYGPLGYGFPNGRHADLAEKVGIGKSMGTMVELRWQALPDSSFFGTRIKKIEKGNTLYQEKIDSLWGEMASDLLNSAVGVRDWKYLSYRYFEHPEIEYEVLMVSKRFTGSPLGTIVLKRVENAVELMDIVAPLRNLKVLIQHARRMVARWGGTELYCWIPKNQLKHFSTLEGAERDLGIAIPNSSWTNHPRAEIFNDKWWLMSGDTDFR